MTEEKEIHGLTPVRTARLIASMIALMGMVFLLIERVLSAVLTMATEGVKMGLARYNNFTGQFAANNFAQDKQLLKLLKEVKDILPTVEGVLTVLLVVAIVLLVIAVAGLALPRQFAHVLVAMKLLKWETGEDSAETGGSLRDTLTRFGNIPIKKFGIPSAIVLAVIVAFFAVRSCHESVLQGSVDSAVQEMQQRSVTYIEAQRAYFLKTKTVGGSKVLQLEDSISTDYFDYKITQSRFVASSKVNLGNCPAGSKWSIVASAKGFFEKELQFARQMPKDSACVKLTPDYKKVGRK